MLVKESHRRHAIPQKQMDVPSSFIPFTNQHKENEMNQNEIVATPAAVGVALQGVSMGYQQIEAEFARYEAEAAALKQRMDALKERRKDMRQQACNQVLPEIVERMTTHGITLEQVRAALAAAKPAATVIHKYWNPETRETDSGKGTLPA
jgi:hypothetical protein